MTAPDNVRRQEYIAQLRAVADFLEANPTFRVTRTGVRVAALHYGMDDPEDPKVFMARHARMLGTAEKSARGDDYFDVRRAFGPHEVSVVAARADICERVVVGTETIEVDVPPPGVTMLTETREVEVVEWICPPSILAALDRVDAWLPTPEPVVEPGSTVVDLMAALEASLAAVKDRTPKGGES